MTGSADSADSADRGSASLWLLAVGLLLLTAGLAAASVGTAGLAAHRARVAADLGALAGAVRAIDGAEAACIRAGDIVAANGGRLVRCRLDSLDLVVTAAVRVQPLPRLTRVVEVSARAGPIRSGP